MTDQQRHRSVFSWFRVAFVMIGIVMAALYFRDALMTAVVTPNLIKGAVWVLLVLLAVALDVWSRRAA